MTITNGYATLAQFKTLKGIKSSDVEDDALIEDLITRASRLIDQITTKWFYAATLTRYYAPPAGRALKLDAPLLTVTTLTNGDGQTIAASEYALWPRNTSAHTEIRLHATSTTTWQPATDDDYPVSVAGTWGMCSRAASDPESARHITATEFAALQIALNWYLERKGAPQGQIQVTQAGIVITPYGAIPKAAYDAIAHYIPKV